MWKVVKGNIFILAIPNIFLANNFQPEPVVESLPVEPAAEFEAIQSPGYSRNQRGKRSLQQDKTETVAS